LPNLSDKYLGGSATLRSVFGNNADNIKHTITLGQMPVHAHGFSIPTYGDASTGSLNTVDAGDSNHKSNWNGTTVNAGSGE